MSDDNNGSTEKQAEPTPAVLPPKGKNGVVYNRYSTVAIACFGVLLATYYLTTVWPYSFACSLFFVSGVAFVISVNDLRNQNKPVPKFIKWIGVKPQQSNLALIAFSISVVFCLWAFAETYTLVGIIDTAIASTPIETLKNLSCTELVTTSTCEANTYDQLTAWYFSIVTFTTLGFGDFRPSCDARFFVTVQALLGYIMLSLLAAKIYKALIGS